MSDLAIKVNDVSKAYLIGLKENRHETLGGKIFSWLKTPTKNYNTLKRLNTFRHNDEREDLFWALKNISFDLKHGETLGIIGKNGAGKSTILKILSRITNPTFGNAEVYGRVSSLLEVGTGFNPDLTGRENVYLNGTILGMKKKEIDKKFDEIVYFSDIEKFIDTQVKKYSSGMRIRLAFAVAANIQTEIMIIDEVLSIGDAEFQKKSVAKMIQIAKQGTAVILVSHNMFPIQSMCTRAILIQKGNLIKDGKTDEVVSEYLGQLTKDKTSQNWEIEAAPGSEFIKFTKAEIRPLNNHYSVIRPGDPFEFEFGFHILFDEQLNINITFHLTDEYENLVFVGSTAMTNIEYKAGKGFVTAFCRVPENLLNTGKFTISKFLILKGFSNVLYEHRDLLTFELTNSLLDKHGKNGKIDGLLKPKLDWEVIVENKKYALK